MSLADYVAKRYLNPDRPLEDDVSAKKRKKKQPRDVPGITIADDDAHSWVGTALENAQDIIKPTTYGRSSEFRKSKKNNWTTLGVPTPSNSEQAAADAIIASTANEISQSNDHRDEQPQVIEDADMATMESEARAGLQSAEQVTAAIEQRKAAELQRFQSEMRTGKGEDTIYRDASGRIINIAMKRAEARKKAQEEEARKAAELDASKGDVQRAERETRKQNLADAKFMTVARYADDATLNEELKDRERWNDPAAQFLTKSTKAKSLTGKPIYKGSAPPNRYNIRPGHRWDGVDRGNGFEKEYFAAQNKRKNMQDLTYQWQYDV